MLKLKKLVHFLQKKRQINFDIYINHIQIELDLKFYKHYIRKKNFNLDK